MTVKLIKIFKNKIVRNKKGNIIKYVALNNKFFKRFGEIYFNEIYLNKKKGWNLHKKNVCLIGDSAHAATPNMGQGACQAIEDAFVLSECIEKYGITKAFFKYQELRLSKAHRIVKTSWYVGKIAHIKNPILIGLRNQILKLTPSSISKKQNQQIFKLTEL